jgi:hypothetical protein
MRTWYTAHGMQQKGKMHPPMVHVSFWPIRAADWRLIWHGPQKTVSRQMPIGQQSQNPVLNSCTDMVLFLVIELHLIWKKKRKGQNSGRAAPEIPSLSRQHHNCNRRAKSSGESIWRILITGKET